MKKLIAGLVLLVSSCIPLHPVMAATLSDFWGENPGASLVMPLVFCKDVTNPVPYVCITVEVEGEIVVLVVDIFKENEIIEQVNIPEMGGTET